MGFSETMMRLLVLLMLICEAQMAIAQPTVLIEAPVRITADAVAVSNASKVPTKSAAASATTALGLAINRDSYEFRLTVMQRGSPLVALAAQKARSGWKDGYLFIRDDCLAAIEAKRAWRCVVDQVFTFVDSRDGKRLVHLGEIFAGDDCLEETKFGCALYQGAFTDLYDSLEKNSLVGRADSPALLLEIRVASGEFVVDLDETWGRNQERFTAGERCLAAMAAEQVSDCTDGITPRGAYLFNSALATYTRRTDNLQRIRRFARGALCESRSEAECSETLRLSALMLAGIRPGEKPRPRGNVKSMSLQTAR